MDRLREGCRHSTDPRVVLGGKISDENLQWCSVQGMIFELISLRFLAELSNRWHDHV